MKRFNLSLRTVTKHTTRSTSNDNTADLESKVDSFLNHLAQLKLVNSIDRIVNMDQTPVWLNIGSTGRIVDFKASKCVQTVIPSGNAREKCTVILACDQTGQKLPPCMIVRSTKKKARISLKNGVLVFNNPGTSMANSNIMSQWIKLYMASKSASAKTILILDSFRGHLTDQIKQTCNDNNVLRAVIPGGLTSRCQPLDLTVNRSFKSQLRHYYRRHGLKETKAASQTISSFNLNVLTQGVRHAWNRVKSETIRNGFSKMYSASARGV